MPILASAMDSVVDANMAAAMGKLGGLAVLNIQGLQTRYENTDDVYSSNNPLNPASDAVAAIEEHHLTKFSLSSRIVFGQKYITRPDGKMNMNAGKYPALGFTYTKAFLATAKGYEYDFLEARLNYSKTLANKGDLDLNMKAGKFFNADNISFADYKHFNGNQTHVRIDGQYIYCHIMRNRQIINTLKHT